MSDKIKWSSELETGIDLIDSQHKILFDLANDLNTTVISGANMRVVDTLFSVLTSYALNHFESEEKLFENKPDYYEHCYKHYKLIKQLHDYIVEYHNGRSADISPGDFLEEWLLNHIKECDIPVLLDEPVDLTMYAETDQIDNFDTDDSELRAHKRMRYDSVLDEEITAHCFNATKMKNGTASVIDLSSGGLKIYCESSHEVDDLLIISCSIGRTFKMREKVRVKNYNENLYGVEFVSLEKETEAFLLQLYGAVQQY